MNISFLNRRRKICRKVSKLKCRKKRNIQKNLNYKSKKKFKKIMQIKHIKKMQSRKYKRRKVEIEQDEK